MDTEYDVRPWKASDDVIKPSDDVISAVSESDSHAQIKDKLDTEVRYDREYNCYLISCIEILYSLLF